MAEKVEYGDKPEHKCLMAISLQGQVIEYNVGYTMQDARKWMSENRVEQQVIFSRICYLLSGKSTMKITNEEETLAEMIKKSEEPVVAVPICTECLEHHMPDESCIAHEEPPQEEVTE